MKNVHLIPTENQHTGCLSLTPDGRLSTNLLIGIPHHIYITSVGEPVKKGDWFLDTISNTIHQVVQSVGVFNTRKKIILTSDPELIKDGIQAIDDEFLEWFIKNPSCEEVEIKKNKTLRLDGSNQRELYHHYRIVNPNIITPIKGYVLVTCATCIFQSTWKFEEPCNTCYKHESWKPHVGLNQQLKDLEVDLKVEEPKQTDENGKPLTYWGGLAEHKPETLEEAAERNHNEQKLNTYTPYSFSDAFKDGVKWQQERSYSEEDIENIWNRFVKELPPINNGASSDFLVYLKQFKNK